MPANQHAIAAGWDQALLDLDLITSFTDGAGNSLPPPRALGLYIPGIVEPRGDFSLTVAGVASVQWAWDQIERSLRKVIKNAYCGTGLNDLSGKVTINTPIEDPDAYYLCNAWLYLEPIANGQYDGSTDWYTNFAMRFVIDEILDTP